jgi:small-conductance mechanosensitive channel
MKELPNFTAELLWFLCCMAVLIVLAVIQTLCDKKSKGDPNRWCAVEFLVGIVLALMAALSVGLIGTAIYMLITLQFQ